MDRQPVAGCPDTHLVDNYLHGAEGRLATYLLDAERPVVVDAGTADGAERILAAMDEIGIDPADVAYVVITHIHLDHAAGTSRVLAACENATVLVHERGYPFLTDPDRLARLVQSVDAVVGEKRPYGDPDPIPERRCRALSGGETLDLGDRVLDVYDAPGHAPHHLTCLEPDSGTLFAGDAVGAYDRETEAPRPSTPAPSFDLDANLATVERLREAGPSRILYCHFGPGKRGAATAELAGYAETLREWVADVREARERVGDDPDALLDVLLPKWEMPVARRHVLGVCGYLDAE